MMGLRNAMSHGELAEQGWLTYQNGDLNEAMKCLEQAIELEPSDGGYHRQLGILYWAASRNDGNMKDKALAQFLESVKLDPSQAEVFRYLGHYYKDRFEDVQRAIRCYQKSISLNAEDEEAGEALCDLLDNRGQEVLEIDVCREASERSRRAFWACRRLGFLQTDRKEWSEAVPNLQHALRGYVTDAYLWEALGLAYQNLGMLTAALKAYKRAITLENSSPAFSLMQSGNILLLLASYDKAINVFQEALQKMPKHVGALCGLAAAMLGRARECMTMGAFSWSAAIAKDAVGILSGSITSCSTVGAFWKLLGDLEVTYAQALPCELMDSVNFSTYDLDPQSLHGLRASIDLWTQSRLSCLRNSVQYYEQALQLCPSQGSLHADLGVAFDFISSLEKNKADDRTTWLPAVKAVCGGLGLNGDKPDLWVTLGMVTKHKGLRQHAFIQALRIDGTHALAWGGLGQLYLGEGNDELARDAFDNARCANPALPIPWAGMAYFHSFIESEKDIQEAYASCLYAVQLAPTVEAQLGLGKLAARTNQLHVPEVYTAIEQAVQHAPLQAAAHNLKGLSREACGDYEGAIQAFLLARYAVSLQSVPTQGSSSTEDIAVSINLARVLCKAGSPRAAIQEYEMLGNLGFLQEDAGALRGYAVALWKSGSTGNAVTMARKSAEVDVDERAAVSGRALVAKMVYSMSGPAYALEEIRAAPKKTLSTPRFFLASLAVAVISGDEKIIGALMRGCSTFSSDISEQAHLLAATGKQIFPRNEDYEGESAIRHLQKALHLYPQSYSLRAKLGEMLLHSSFGDKTHLVTRCCGVELSHSEHNVHYGSLCGTLSAATCACALCGRMGSFNFCLCQSSFADASSLSRHLQRWIRKEPWNVKAHYHLVLTLLQLARAQDYPINLCQTTRRMATTALSILSMCTHMDETLRRIHLMLLVAISECYLHVGAYNDAIQAATSARKVEVATKEEVFALVQLARCYAAAKDYKSSAVELSIVRSILTADDISSWLALIELEHLCKLKDSSSMEICQKAILQRGPDEQKRWMGLFHLVCANGFIQASDLWSALKVAAEAVALLPEDAAFHLLHGAVSLELVAMGSNAEQSSIAVQSLTKAVKYSGNSTVTLLSMLLCKAHAATRKSTSGDLSKWERKLWTVWSAWPRESRPAELYYQMGLLAKKAQGAVLGASCTPEVSWNSRGWLQRAVHLRPDSEQYRTSLEEQ